jgi:hypothetical protein
LKIFALDRKDPYPLNRPLLCDFSGKIYTTMLEAGGF